MAENKDGVFTVIHCKEDDSHVLVGGGKVIHTGDLNCDDEVKFYFLNPSGKNQLYTGTIKGISKDYGEMVKLLNFLNINTRPKREPSFHENQPRRAKLAAKLKAFTKGVSETKPSSSKTSLQKQNRKRVQVINSSDEEVDLNKDDQDKHSNADGDGGHVSDSHSSDESCTATIIDQDSSKFKETTLKKNNLQISNTKIIVSKAASKGNDKSLHEKGKETSEMRTKGTKSFHQEDKTLDSHGHMKSMDSEDEGANVRDDSNSEGHSDTKKSANSTNNTPMVSVQMIQCQQKRGAKQKVREMNQITFHGQFLAYGDSQVNQKVHEDYNVFIPIKDMKKLKNNCASTSTLTRKLTRIVFTDEAREHCSVSGKPSMVKGELIPEKRTPLDQNGVNAILEFVKSRAKKKNWTVPSDTTMKQWMANVLCEERLSLRLQKEAEEAEKKKKEDEESKEENGQESGENN